MIKTNRIYLLFICLFSLYSFTTVWAMGTFQPPEVPADNRSDYFIDSVSGNDNNSGTSDTSPWKTISKVSSRTFQPGDNIYFKRGSAFSGCVTINGNGNASNPITISAYGSGNAPRFTNNDYYNHLQF